MDNKNNQLKKLQLNKLTVCRLTPSEESRVKGGGLSKSGVSCIIITCNGSGTFNCATTTDDPTQSCNC